MNNRPKTVDDQEKQREAIARRLNRISSIRDLKILLAFIQSLCPEP